MSRASRHAALPVLLHGSVSRHSDLVLIALFVAVIALMVLPLPPWALDGLIAANLATSVLVLIIGVYIASPLGLSTFPAMLLFTTLFRLALNIASTRQILLTGNAGEIINAFGRMVVGGDIIVGLVVFLIIALVQFIVIAKGSERIAEVAARFSLDAMPGKQMSIDADLRAGIIHKDEARQRRQALESESQLYGAMDGAMKFVKGDAIAGMVITAVNIVGGILVGALRKGLSFDAATRAYSVLAVGDAMVSQIPSLLLSVAAGVVVTRVARSDGRQGNLAQDIVAQVAAHPRALMVAGMVVLGMAAVPGFPLLQFGLLGLGAFLAGWWLSPARLRRRGAGHGHALTALAREGSEQVQRFGEFEPPAWSAAVRLRLASDLAARIDAERLETEVAQVRIALRRSWGLPFPGLALELGAPAGHAVFEAHGAPVLAFELPGPGYRLLLGAARPAHGPALPGPELFGTPSCWVLADSANGAETPHHTADTLALEAVLALAMRRLVEMRPHRFIGVHEAQLLCRQLESQLPELERELRQAVPLPRLADVCRRLLEERVALTDLPGLAQALVDHAGREKDTAQLVERLRQALGEQISHQHANARGELPAVLLTPELEERLVAGLQLNLKGSALALPPSVRESLIGRLADAVSGAPPASGAACVLVHTAALRPALRSLMKESAVPETAVLCPDELRPNLSVLVVGEVDVDVLMPAIPGAAAFGRDAHLALGAVR